MAKNRKSLTLRQKLKLIKKVNGGAKKSVIAQKYQIAKSTLSTILKNQDKIIAKSESNQNLNVKKIRNPNNVHLERAVMIFIMKSRDANIPLNGPIVQEQVTFVVCMLFWKVKW